MTATTHADAAASGQPDAVLLVHVSERNVTAFETLYDRYAPALVGLAMRVLGNRDEAEEVAQEVFWRIWTDDLRYEPARGRFATWLFVITKNSCIDRLRARARTETSRVSLLIEATAQSNTAPGDPEGDSVLSQRRSRVRGALAGLPAEQREALEWCFLRGLTHREAAERLRTPLGTLKSRVKLAMAKLRETLADVEEEP